MTWNCSGSTTCSDLVCNGVGLCDGSPLTQQPGVLDADQCLQLCKDFEPPVPMGPWVSKTISWSINCVYNELGCIYNYLDEFQGLFLLDLWHCASWLHINNWLPECWSDVQWLHIRKGYLQWVWFTHELMAQRLYLQFCSCRWAAHRLSTNYAWIHAHLAQHSTDHATATQGPLMSSQNISIYFMFQNKSGWIEVM